MPRNERGEASPAANSAEGRADTGAGITYSSGTVRCPEHGCTATIGILGKSGGPLDDSYVCWCSVCGIKVECEQACKSEFHGKFQHDMGGTGREER